LLSEICWFNYSINLSTRVRIVVLNSGNNSVIWHMHMFELQTIANKMTKDQYPHTIMLCKYSQRESGWDLGHCQQWPLTDRRPVWSVLRSTLHMSPHSHSYVAAEAAEQLLETQSQNKLKIFRDYKNELLTKQALSSIAQIYQ